MVDRQGSISHMREVIECSLASGFLGDPARRVESPVRKGGAAAGNSRRVLVVGDTGSEDAHPFSAEQLLENFTLRSK